MEPQVDIETATIYSPEEVQRSRLWCRDVARRAAKNFYYSFLALSGEKFHGMCALYAFMRVTDDLGDEPGKSVEQREDELSQWQSDLLNLTTKHIGSHPVWPALHDTQQKFGIPIGQLSEVIDGVRRDLRPVEMQTFEELQRYCYQVAGVVGLSCLRIWGTNHPEADRLAIDCGMAFQLTNILRDLKEDSGLGRVYLPAEDLGRFGYSRQNLDQGLRNGAFQGLMQFELERARSYYRSAEGLESYLNDEAKPVLRTMFRIYQGILDEIERRDFDVFSGRVRLSAWSKSQIVMRELLRSRWRW